MSESILRDKAFSFALRIIKLNRLLVDEHKEFVLAKQVLRSGTSIGANLEEARHGQSALDFIHKLSIAQKEAAETNYWLRLLSASGYVNEKLGASLLSDCEELQRMLTASIKTVKLKRAGSELTAHNL
ncbi:MAG: four helix bundle protein [Pyrinomonadaceae bacterium]